MMLSMPAATASSTPYWMIGLSTSGSISFGWALVAGRNRVPRPAAGMAAFFTFTGSSVSGRWAHRVCGKTGLRRLGLDPVPPGSLGPEHGLVGGGEPTIGPALGLAGGQHLEGRRRGNERQDHDADEEQSETGPEHHVR